MLVAAWSGLAVCLVGAIVDEAHPAMIPTRYGSVRDVLIDLSGVGGALLLARGRMAAREHAQVGPGIGIEPVE